MGRLTLFALALVACSRTNEVHAEDAAPPPPVSSSAAPRASATAAEPAPSSTSAPAADPDAGKRDGGRGKAVTKATVALASYDARTLAPDRAKIEAATADVVECTKKTPGYFAPGDQFFLVVEYDPKGVPQATRRRIAPTRATGPSPSRSASPRSCRRSPSRR